MSSCSRRAPTTRRGCSPPSSCWRSLARCSTRSSIGSSARRCRGTSRTAARSREEAAMKDDPIEPGDRDVLVVVDVQNDFCTGSLAIPGSEAIIPAINRLARRFAHVVLTQDWHPPGHVSFASAHAGRQPGDVVTVAYGPQKLFRDHCVQGTEGSAFHPGLDLS